MEKKELWKLIQRSLTDDLSPVEERRLREWVMQDESNRRLIDEVEKLWELSPGEDFSVDVEDAWERFLHRKKQKSRTKEMKYAGRPRSDGIVQILRVAAVLLVVGFAGYFANEFLVEKEEPKQDTGQFYVMQDMTTDKGEKARVRFSDGTQVMLNAASTLRFPKQFRGNVREVYLDGEAYFEVAHDPEHPFIVHAADADVKVLGTTFNVRGWSEDRNTDVAVREGKVSVTSKGKKEDQSEVVLSKGQHTRVMEGAAPATPKNINVDTYLLWTRGGVHFDNAPLSQVLRHVERKFDVTIEVRDQVSDVPFTSTFRDAELDEVLKVIAAAMEMDYYRDGEKITFR